MKIAQGSQDKQFPAVTTQQGETFWALTVSSARDALRLYFDPLMQIAKWIRKRRVEPRGQHALPAMSPEIERLQADLQALMRQAGTAQEDEQPGWYLKKRMREMERRQLWRRVLDLEHDLENNLRQELEQLHQIEEWMSDGNMRQLDKWVREQTLEGESQRVRLLRQWVAAGNMPLLRGWVLEKGQERRVELDQVHELLLFLDELIEVTNRANPAAM